MTIARITPDDEPFQSTWPTRIVVALGIILLIGMPLFGRGVFAGTDLLERFDPWSTTVPDLDGIDNTLRGDEIDVRLPARRQVAEGLRRGDLPLWQSDVNGGVPLAAVPNTSSLSPVNAAYWFLPTWWAPAVTKLLEVLLAIAGTVALLRGHFVRRDVGLLAGFLVAFSGFTIVWSGSAVAPLVAMFPAMLWSVDHALRTRTITGHVPLAVLVAVGWLQGFPAGWLVELLLAGAWAVWSTIGTEPVRRLVRPLASLGGAVVVGTGLAWFQLATFLDQLGGIETDGRAQTVTDHLPFDHLLTLALPFARGDDATWSGVANASESHTWLGVVPLVLVGLWAWHGAPRAIFAMANRLTSFLATVAGTLTVLVWFGGWPLAVAQMTPLLSINPVSRLRGLAMAAAILLGALGLEAHLQRAPRVEHRSLPILRVGALAAVAVAAFVTGLPDAIHEARLAGRGAELQADIVLLTVGLAVVPALLWTARSRRMVAALLVPGLLVVAALETKRVTSAFWSDVPREAFYPSTPAHEFLQANLGDDRTASAERALYPGTTTWYGIRTAAGHAFPPLPWREAVLAVDPHAYDGSLTQPLLSPTPEVARSPVLDRLAVRWWVTDLDHPPIGEAATIEFVATANGFEGTLPADRPFRSVVLPSTAGLVSSTTSVTTEVVANGTVVASAVRRLLPTRLERPVVLSVPEAAGDTLRVTWEGSPTPPSALGTFDAVFAPDNDVLSLAHTDGILAYERAAALPRFRWASRALVESDPVARLAALANGTIPDDTVVLHADAGPLDGGIRAADLIVGEADGDVLRIAVDAGDAGWLVVADSLQQDWVAEVDGEVVDLLDADHVGVAVALPAGQHEVVLTYRPATVRSGAAISLATLLVGLGLLVVARRRSTDRDDG